MTAGSLAADRATPAELRAVEAAHRQCRHGFAQRQVEPSARGDDDFHTAVAVASHNAFLDSAVRGARRLQRRSSAIGIHDEFGEDAAAAIEEHEAIHRAVEQGRPDRAAEATGTHLDRTLETYRREIRRRLLG
ncbi:FCD domain-containing protein [Kitasatospora phosalacinea]|uniref:FCD domain-containing protein n=1 Tax=Kitasatospora phosalacinea TaxID=2065 RepID=UPI00068D266D